MNSRWVSLNEAVGILGISLSTLRRRIDKGEIETKLVNGKRFIQIPDEVQVNSNIIHSVVEQLKDEVQGLRQRIAREEKKNEELQRHLDEAHKASEEASQRHDTIVLQLTRQLEQSQRLLEYHKESFWRRWFRKHQKNELD